LPSSSSSSSSDEIDRLVIDLGDMQQEESKHVLVTVEVDRSSGSLVSPPAVLLTVSYSNVLIGMTTIKSIKYEFPEEKLSSSPSIQIEEQRNRLILLESLKSYLQSYDNKILQTALSTISQSVLFNSSAFIRSLAGELSAILSLTGPRNMSSALIHTQYHRTHVNARHSRCRLVRMCTAPRSSTKRMVRSAITCNITTKPRRSARRVMFVANWAMRGASVQQVDRKNDPASRSNKINNDSRMSSVSCAMEEVILLAIVQRKKEKMHRFVAIAVNSRATLPMIVQILSLQQQIKKQATPKLSSHRTNNHRTNKQFD